MPNDDFWKTALFYRRSTWPRYVALISRSIIAGHVAARPECEFRILKRITSLQAPPDTWQRTQNASLAFNRATSFQQREVWVSISKSTSLQQSESCVSTSKTASLQLAYVFEKQESCASIPSMSCISTLMQVRVCNVQSRISTSSERRVFTLRETRTLAK